MITKRAYQQALLEAKPNIVDRMVGYFDPVQGQRRHLARVAMAMAGSYTGASKSKRSTLSWRTSPGDADADINEDLPTLRERSRDLIRNNPLAAGAIHTKTAHVVGTGLKLHAQIDAEYLGMADAEAEAWQATAEREFNLWARSQDCDITRTLTFNGVQELVFRSVLENGDIFCLLPHVERPGRIYSLAVQLIEADRVSNPEDKADSAKISGGVERDPAGAPVAYHIRSAHPGSLAGDQKATWARVPAFGAATGRRNALHLYRKLRVGQSRGVPDMAPVIDAIKQIGTYTDAEITAAVVSGMFTTFIKSEGGYGLDAFEPSAETGGSSDDADYKLAPGAILELQPNEDIVSANPGRPNPQFDPFVLSILRQVGVALELPFEILVGHFTSSYSAARAALLHAWKFFLTRRQWLAMTFCQPVYEEWMAEAVAIGRIQAPGFFDDESIRQAYLGATWVGPSPGQIDPYKEAKANEINEDRGWKTSAEITAETTGGDWEKKHTQRAREHAMRQAAGLIQAPTAVDGTAMEQD